MNIKREIKVGMQLVGIAATGIAFYMGVAYLIIEGVAL